MQENAEYEPSFVPVLESLAWLDERLTPIASKEVLEHLKGIQAHVREWKNLWPLQLNDGSGGGE